VVVVLHGNRREATLIDRSLTQGVAARAPGERVAARECLHEAGHVVIATRPDDEVPMVRHAAEAEQPHSVLRHRPLEAVLEDLIVVIGLEQAHAVGRSIHHVEDHPARRDANA
jgi:hypothetical protein